MWFKSSCVDVALTFSFTSRSTRFDAITFLYKALENVILRVIVATGHELSRVTKEIKVFKP